MRHWKPVSRQVLFRHALFELERQELSSGDRRREAVVLHPPRWVNVVAQLDDRCVLLVRQWRLGIGAFTLEIPGGMVEEEEDDLAAARRELLEETGFRARSWARLGEVHPNPAFQSNTTVSFLARDLERLHDTPPGDGEEEIEVISVPLREIPARIARGDITHSLVICAFHFLFQRGEGPA